MDIYELQRRIRNPTTRSEIAEEALYELIAHIEECIDEIESELGCNRRRADTFSREDVQIWLNNLKGIPS